MDDNTFGYILIIGKGAIWLIIPLLLGLWELRRHRKMMREDKDRPANLPSWLQRREINDVPASPPMAERPVLPRTPRGRPTVQPPQPAPAQTRPAREPETVA